MFTLPQGQKAMVEFGVMNVMLHEEKLIAKQGIKV